MTGTGWLILGIVLLALGILVFSVGQLLLRSWRRKLDADI